MEFFQENIHLGEVIVQITAFLIVLFTLKKFAWGPLLGALEARRARIQSEFDKIEETKKEIASLKADYAVRMQKIEDEARAKIQEAVDEGHRVAREMQEKARLESQASFDKAKENIELEAAKARIALRKDIADLALSVSEKILKEKMTSSKEQQDKILNIIEDLEKSL